MCVCAGVAVGLRVCGVGGWELCVCVHGVVCVFVSVGMGLCVCVWLWL